MIIHLILIDYSLGHLKVISLLITRDYFMIDLPIVCERVTLEVWSVFYISRAILPDDNR